MSSPGKGLKAKMALAIPLFVLLLCGSSWAAADIKATLGDDGRIAVSASYDEGCNPSVTPYPYLSIDYCPGNYTVGYGCGRLAYAVNTEAATSYDIHELKEGVFTFTATGYAGVWQSYPWGGGYCALKFPKASALVYYKNENSIEIVLPAGDTVNGKETIRAEYLFTNFKDGVDYSSVSLQVCPSGANGACVLLNSIMPAGKSGAIEAEYDFGDSDGEVAIVASACRKTWCAKAQKPVIPADPCEPVAMVSDDFVWPRGMGEKDQTMVEVSLNEAAPSAGCAVELAVEPVEGTGGHVHEGGRPSGTLDRNVVFIPGGTMGPVMATYRSSEVAGAEKVMFRAAGGDAWQSVNVMVRVPGLEPFSDGGVCRLSGEGSAHRDGHYATGATNLVTSLIAREYFELTGTMLGINDMSLAWGGLFDVAGGWEAPHVAHRMGTGVDVDRDAWEPEEELAVVRPCEEDQELRAIVYEYGGAMACEWFLGEDNELTERKHIEYQEEK